MQTHTWQLALVTSLTHSSSRSLLLMHLNIFVITAACFVAGDLLTHTVSTAFTLNLVSTYLLNLFCKNQKQNI